MEGQKIVSGRFAAELKRELRHFRIAHLRRQSAYAPQAPDVGDGLDVESQDGSHGRRKCSEDGDTILTVLATAPRDAYHRNESVQEGQ
jgi:hypothetical protein